MLDEIFFLLRRAQKLSIEDLAGTYLFRLISFLMEHDIDLTLQVIDRCDAKELNQLVPRIYSSIVTHNSSKIRDHLVNKVAQLRDFPEHPLLVRLIKENEDYYLSRGIEDYNKLFGPTL